MPRVARFRQERSGRTSEVVLPPKLCSLFIRLFAMLHSVGRWCTVTVTDAEGRRHSVDLVADSSYDAAHLFVAQARSDRSLMLPAVSRETTFEVVSNGRLYLAHGEKLREWILN